MKTLILISIILLLGCADNITNSYKSYSTDKGKTWCSDEYYGNGDVKEMYTIAIDTSIVENQYTSSTKFYNVTLDSVKGDTLFISTSEGKKWIVENPYSIIDRIEYSFDYGFVDPDFPAYVKSKIIIRCLN